jgi:hypothetical protein
MNEDIKEPKQNMVLIQEGMQVSDTMATGSTKVDTLVSTKVDTTINLDEVEVDEDDDRIIEEFFGYNPNKIFLVQRVGFETPDMQILYYVDKKEDAVQVMTALLEKEIDSIDKNSYRVFKSLGSNGSVGISTQKIGYAWNGGMVKRCTYEVSMIQKIRRPSNAENTE